MIKGTGALKNPLDLRDIKLAKVQAPVELPKKYKTDISKLPVEDQGALGACVGHAIAKYMQYLDYKETGKVTPLSPRYVYGLSKQLDGISTIEGTYPRVAAKVATDSGCALLSDVPNDVKLSHADYIKVENKGATKRNASGYRVSAFAFAELTANGLMQAIYQNELACISLAVGDFSKEQVKPGKNGLHYVLAYGFEYDSKKKKYKVFFRNSWGKTWGNKGDGWFYLEDFEGQYYDVLAFVDMTNTFIEELTSGYQYFTDKEFLSKGIADESFRRKLDLARLNATLWLRQVTGNPKKEAPIKITSGKRTDAQNDSAGGVEDSAHKKGIAIDLSCSTGEQRIALIQGFISAGVFRIGVYDKHLHIDVDYSKPTPCMFLGGTSH